MIIKTNDETLCMSCDNFKSCTWRANLVPENDWTALKLPYAENKTTYHVYKCPKFQRNENYENEYTEKTEQTKTQWDAFAELWTIIERLDISEHEKDNINSLIAIINDAVCESFREERRKVNLADDARISERSKRMQEEKKTAVVEKLYIDLYCECSRGIRDAKQKAKAEIEEAKRKA